MAVERMRSSENIGDLAKELGVNRRCFYKWQANFDHLEPGEEAPRTSSHESCYRQQVHRLKRLLAENTLEVDFFKGALQKVKASTPEEQRLWRDGIYDQIREVMPLQGNLSIERMRELAKVSRASFHRSFLKQEPVEEELEVHSAIQQIAIEHRRRYGYRRICAELRRRGMQVNHKRVMGIMAEDNLLAVLLDSFSRKVVGWELDRTLAVRLPLAALEQAIAGRKPQPGLVHHSDRGLQYASADYVRVLLQHQMIPRMSRPANPYDNASCESFIKTLALARLTNHLYWRAKSTP